MIFKTFNNDIDKWTAKIGIFGKSFNELGTAINNAFEASIDNIDNFDENIGFWETLKNNLAPKNENGDSWLKNSLGEIISADNINSYIAELDLTSAKDKLTEIFDWEAIIKNGDATWQDYFDTLENGAEHYIPDVIKNTDDLSKLTGDDLVKANQQARKSALAHNEALKQQTLGAKAATVAMKALSIVGNMVVMWAVTEAIQLIQLLVKCINNLGDSLEEVQTRIEENQNALSEYTSKIEELTSKLEELNNTDVTYFSEAEKRELETEKEYVQSQIDLYNQLSEAKQKAINDDYIKATMGKNEEVAIKKWWTELTSGDWEDAGKAILESQEKSANGLNIIPFILTNGLSQYFNKVDDGNYFSEADELLDEYQNLQNRFISLQNMAIDSGNNETLIEKVDETSTEMNQVASDIAEYIEQISEARDALVNSDNADEYAEEIAKMDEAISRYQEVLNGNVYESKYTGYNDLQRDLLGIRDALKVFVEETGINSDAFNEIYENIDKLIRMITILNTYSIPEIFEIDAILIKKQLDKLVEAFKNGDVFETIRNALAEILPPEVIEDFDNLRDSIEKVINKLSDFVEYIANETGVSETLKTLELSIKSMLAPLVEFLDKYSEIFDKVKNAWDEAHELDYSVSKVLKLAEKGADTSSSSTETQDSFTDLIKSDEYEDTKKALIELYKSGELTEDTLTSTREYRDLLTQTGESAKEAMSTIEQLALQEIDFEDYQTQLENARSSISELQDILAEVKENNGTLSDDSIDKIISDYPTLINYLGNTEELQSHINELISEQAEIADIASDKMLEYSAEVYDAVLNSTEDVLNGITICVEGETKGLTDYLSDAYDTDLRNFSNLAQAKEKIEVDLIKTLSEYMQDFYGLQKDAITGTYAVTQNLSSFYSDTEAQSKLAAYNEAMTKLNATAERFKNLSTSTFSGISTGSSSSSSSESDTTKQYNWIEVAINRVQEAIARLTKVRDNSYIGWTKRNKALNEEISGITDEINLQTQAYEYYMNRANSIGLSQEYIDKIQSGAIQIEDITDENLQDKIDEFQDLYEKAIECKDAVQELNIEISELAEQKFDNLKTQFDDLISRFESQSSIIEERINRVQEQGYFEDKSYYQQLADIESKSLTKLKNEYNTLRKELNSAVSAGTITEGSEAWESMRQEIYSVEQAIEESTTALVEYNNAIRDLNWEIFDYIEERLDTITSESEFLIDLLDNNNLYEDNGWFNSDGKSVAALHGINYNTYMKESIDYGRELAEIESQLANDKSNKDLIERREELLDLQQEAITNAEAEKEAIQSLVQDGIELHLDALSSVIDKYKEAMQSAKNLYEYQKNISEQTQNISDLEKILSAYEGDDSEESRKIIQETTNKLEDAKIELQETEWEQYISETEDLLDDLYSDYEEVLNARLDDIDALIADMIDMINESSTEIREAIENATASVGYDTSSYMDNILSGGSDSDKNILSNFEGKFESASTTIIKTITAIKNSIDSAHTTNGVSYSGGGVYGGNYSNTKAISDIYLNDDVVLQPVGSSLLTTAQSEALLVNVQSSLPNVGSSLSLSNLPQTTSSNTVINNDNTVTITLPNATNYNEFKSDLQKDSKFIGFIQSVTLGEATGKGKLNRNKY